MIEMVPYIHTNDLVTAINLSEKRYGSLFNQQSKVCGHTKLPASVPLLTSIDREACNIRKYTTQLQMYVKDIGLLFICQFLQKAINKYITRHVVIEYLILYQIHQFRLHCVYKKHHNLLHWIMILVRHYT